MCSFATRLVTMNATGNLGEGINIFKIPDFVNPKTKQHFSGKHIIFESSMPRDKLPLKLSKLLTKFCPGYEDIIINRDLMDYKDLTDVKTILFKKPPSVRLKAMIPWNSVCKIIIEVSCYIINIPNFCFCIKTDLDTSELLIHWPWLP